MSLKVWNKMILDNQKPLTEEKLLKAIQIRNIYLCEDDKKECVLDYLDDYFGEDDHIVVDREMVDDLVKRHLIKRVRIRKNLSIYIYIDPMLLN